MIHKKNKLVGRMVKTIHGVGRVKQVEEFIYNNTIMFGVKHVVFPESKQCIRKYAINDILYYLRKDLKILSGVSNVKK